MFRQGLTLTPQVTEDSDAAIILAAQAQREEVARFLHRSLRDGPLADCPLFYYVRDYGKGSDWRTRFVRLRRPPGGRSVIGQSDRHGKILLRPRSVTRRRADRGGCPKSPETGADTATRTDREVPSGTPSVSPGDVRSVIRSNGFPTKGKQI